MSEEQYEEPKIQTDQESLLRKSKEYVKLDLLILRFNKLVVKLGEPELQIKD